MLIKFLNGAQKEIADLRTADLRGANLYGASLYGADLRGADLRGANLRGADLNGADLRGANLYGANLRGADLRGANLRGASLRGADLRDADLENATGLDQFCILPAGTLIGYKKLANGKIAKLRIAADTPRINAYGSRKCRAAKVTVVDGTGVGRYSGKVKYAPRRIVKADSFDPDPRIECSHGIHFFITKQEAKDY